MVVIVSIWSRKYPKFGVTLKTFNVKVNRLAKITFSSRPKTIVAILDYNLKEVLWSVANENYVRIRIKFRSLPFSNKTPLMKKSQVIAGRWMDEVERVLNSNKSLVSMIHFLVAVQYVALPSGRCLQNVPGLLRNMLQARLCVTRIKNQGALCMARALVVGKSYADGGMKLYLNCANIMKPRRQPPLHLSRLLHFYDENTASMTYPGLRRFEL